MLNTSTAQQQPYATSRPTSLLLPPTTQQQTSTSSIFTPQTFPTLLTPTSGTPLAMTPNTLRSIEQSILQTLGEDPEASYMMESQQYSGNFVPPLPSSTSTITLINTWQGGQVSSSEAKDEGKANAEEEVDEKPVLQIVETKGKKKPTQQTPQQQKKKPAPKTANKRTPAPPKEKPQPKAKQQKAQPTEEDERRRIRRERNKLAAARCRKRRVDHTNKLLEETEGLEAKKRSLQNQINELQSQKEELEFILEAHTCTKKIKSDVQVLTDLQNLPARSDTMKLKRPNTLNVASTEQRPTPVNVSTPAPPIPINTPSNGIAGLGFEPLCSDWGVNTPTPVSETSTVGVGDDKTINVPESRDLISSKCNSSNNSLVTPVNPYKRLHDL